MPVLHAPLIVTLKLDAASSAWLTALREAYFPPERNYLAAHVTLFHALPGSEEAAIREILSAACAGLAPFELEMPRLRSLGRGVAIEVHGEALLRLRAQLARQFCTWLTPQDSQGYRPHVTIQNKVPADVARSLLHAMTQEWRTVQASAEGLLLWEYIGGPWRGVAEFLFSGPSKVNDAVI